MTIPKKIFTKFYWLISSKLHSLQQIDLYDTLSWCTSQIGMKFFPIYFAIANFIGAIPKEQRYSTKGLIYLVISAVYGLFSVYLNIVKSK